MDAMSPRPDAHPDVPAGRPPSLPERAALTVALLVAALGVALPGMALLWILAAAVTTGVASEALERTGGLEPTTFGGGYWMALGLDVAVVLWSVVRRVRGRPGPWKPLVGLVTAYVLLIWFAVVPDLAAIVDVPDVVTTFVLLGADALVSYVFPCMLLALLVRGSGHLWRLGSASSAAAQRIGVAAACLGLACLTLGAGVAAVDLEPRSVDEAFEELEVSLELDGVEGERRMYHALSLGLGSGVPSGRVSAPEVRSAFGECAETLSERRADVRPVVEQAAASLIRGGLGTTDAEDLVMQTLLNVCLRHANEPAANLITYYWGALRNNARTFQRRGQREWSEYDEERDSYSTDLPVDARLALDQDLAWLRTALGELTADEREVLDLHYEKGLSYTAIARRLGMSDAAVRQRAKRALDHLRRLREQRPDLH
jgi:RNA polymerase sigma factor (sigma-70 family)